MPKPPQASSVQAAPVQAKPEPAEASRAIGPRIGEEAPSFDLLADDGARIALSRCRGTASVLYFYPKDDTSGCTLEAQQFSALAADFARLGARVFGLSKDDRKSHQRFKAKYDLNVTLLCDEEARIAAAYGVWVEKSMYGRKYMGVERATFLVAADGRIAQIWRKVKADGHAREVLAAIEALSKSGQMSGNL